MMTESRVLAEVNHRVNGEVSFSVLASTVSIAIRWPLDLEADEWFRATYRVPEDVWSQAIATAGGDGRAEVTDPSMGLLVVSRHADGRTTIDATVTSALHRRLILDLEIGLASLDPALTAR